MTEDEKISTLLKIILENRSDFNSGKRDEVYKKVFQKGIEIEYFAEDYDIAKLKANFWKNQRKTYNVCINFLNQKFAISFNKGPK